MAGRRLKDLAAKAGGYDLAKFAIRKLWNDLPTIHRYWGFSGGIKASNIFFDSHTKKITLINWDRAQLPFVHHPSPDEHIKNYRWHHGVTEDYGRRLLTCWKSPTDVFAVDKEALMICLLSCRKLSQRQNPAAGEDQLSSELSVYYKKFNFFKAPLNKVGKYVTQLMDVLLRSIDETEMCRLI